MVKICNIGKSTLILNDVHRLYASSFPIEERRVWDNFIDHLEHNEKFNVFIIENDGHFIGFISWWDLGCVRYVEHFAIEKMMRNKGIGSDVITQFVSESPVPVVLEAELPETNEMAIRRISFYCRHGFEECVDVDYVQPSYGRGLPAVPMRLMVTDRNMVDIDKVVSLLYRIVYNFH